MTITNQSLRDASCHFCQSGALQWHEIQRPWLRSNWQVICGSCGARGPIADSYVSALSEWNKATAPDPIHKEWAAFSRHQKAKMRELWQECDAAIRQIQGRQDKLESHVKGRFGEVLAKIGVVRGMATAALAALEDKK